MPWQAQHFLEEDRPWEPEDFEEAPDKLTEANAALDELGKVLKQKQKEDAASLTSSEPGVLSQLRTSSVGRSLFGATREEREAQVASQPAPADIIKTVLKFTTAPPQITEPIQRLTDPLINKLPGVAAGVTRGIRDVAMGAIGSLPAGALMAPRLVAAPFAADYVTTLPEQFRAIEESETPAEAAQAITTTALGGALTAAGTAQALKPARRAAIEPQDQPIVLKPETIAEPVAEVAPVKPVQVEPSPNEFVPALRRKEGGDPIVGEKGQIHQDIYNAQGPMANMLRIEQPEHGFVRNGEFFNRDQVSEMLGEKTPIDSQRLRELQAKEKAPAPAATETGTPPLQAQSAPIVPSKAAVLNGNLGDGPVAVPELLAGTAPVPAKAPLDFWGYDPMTGQPKWKSPPNEAGRTTQYTEAKAKEKGFDVKTDIPSKEQWDSQAPVRAQAEAAGKAKAGELFGKSQTPALGTQLGSGIPDPIATVKAAGELISGGITMAKRSELISQAIGKPKEAAPPIRTEVNTPLPDFQEHSASKKIFSQPFGFENLPVIGALFGGTRRLKGHVNETLSTYWAERGIGKANASALGAEYSWLDKPFEIKDGQITNITPAKEGSSRYISDVFEALQKDPDSYTLNAEQKKAFDAVQKLEKDFSRLEQRYDIGKGVDSEASDVSGFLEGADTAKGSYFPRIVVSRPGGVTSGLPKGSSVGSKAFFEKSRLFDTEAEGWAKGYKYEPSIVNRLATRSERLYKRIADKRLAGDKSLEGVGRSEVESQLKASFAEELASGEMTEKKISQMADSMEARGRVYAPAFFNKIFPEETANQLNKAFPKSQSAWRQMAVSINNATKGLQLGLDMGVGFIQGQALLARHPAIWGKAQFNSVAAMLHVEHFPNYVRKNLEPVRELAQLGSGVGRLEEYMAGLEGKGLLSKVPGVQAVTAPFARQFQTFLDVAKVEMWKSYRETTPREQWADVAQTIESVLSSSRMESVGISQNRALTERALLLAPSYYRGGLNMIAAMAEKGASGQIARRAMVAYATAGGVLFYGLGKALGMSDEDLKERMNPARSDFMLWRVKTGGRTSNVGFGGFYRSLLRLMGNTAKTSIENPGNWASLSPEKNPITKWYRGHAGPVVTAAWDGFSGKDYMGEDTDIASIARRAVTPITVQSARGKPGQPTPSAGEAGLSFVGIQSFPVTSKSELNKLHSEWLASNKDPKVKADYERSKKMSFPPSKYSGLNTALADNDEKAVAQSLKDLQAEGVKRSDIFRRMNPYTADGEAEKPLFQDSSAMERKFKKSLTPEQVKLYDQARADRKAQWKLFLKTYRSTPSK